MNECESMCFACVATDCQTLLEPMLRRGNCCYHVGEMKKEGWGVSCSDAGGEWKRKRSVLAGRLAMFAYLIFLSWQIVEERGRTKTNICHCLTRVVQRVWLKCKEQQENLEHRRNLILTLKKKGERKKNLTVLTVKHSGSGMDRVTTGAVLHWISRYVKDVLLPKTNSDSHPSKRTPAWHSVTLHTLINHFSHPKTRKIHRNLHMSSIGYNLGQLPCFAVMLF